MQIITLKECVFFSLLSMFQMTSTASALVNLGNVQVSTIGHSYITNSVSDLLIEQDQSSGGGGELYPVVADWEGVNQFELMISAPAGKKFLVHAPVGQAVQFGGRLEWSRHSSPASYFGSVAVTFSNLVGTLPDFSASRSWLEPGALSFGFENIESTAFTNDLSFTSIKLTATVPTQSYGSPFQTLYFPTSESAFGIYYRTPETNDLSPFVSIVTTSPPMVNLALQPNGEVTITFTDVLQYANDVNGPFDDVPGYPQGTFTIPKGNLITRQYFRARGK